MHKYIDGWIDHHHGVLFRLTLVTMSLHVSMSFLQSDRTLWLHQFIFLARPRSFLSVHLSLSFRPSFLSIQVR